MLDYHREQVAVKDKEGESERKCGEKVADGCRIVCVDARGGKDRGVEQR